MDDQLSDNLEQWLSGLCQNGVASALERVARRCSPTVIRLHRRQPMAGAHDGGDEPHGLPPDPNDVRPVQDDELGPLLERIGRELRETGFRLHYALRHIIQVYRLMPERLAELINGNGLFDQDQTDLCIGLEAWEDEDHASTFQILIPRIEKAVRELVRRINEPMDRPLTIGVMDALYRQRFAQAYGHDLQLELLTVYADARGWNLRDRFVRGRTPDHGIDESVTNWLVHLLLVMGSLPLDHRA